MRSEDRDAGFSLIELVVAMVVLGTMAMAVIGVIMNSQAQGVTNRSRIAAANLAAREIDITREEFTRSAAMPMTIANMGTVVNQHPLPLGTVGQPQVVDGRSYTVTRSVAWNVTGTGQSACSGGTLVDYPTLRVTVTVTWPNMRNVKPVTSIASLAPRKSDGIQGTASFVAVQVKTAAGVANPGRAIKVSSTSETRTGVTDSSGCAVVQVNPASGAGTVYNAQVTDPGLVDITGTTSPSKLVGQLAQGQLNNNVIFTYDRAATVNIRLVDATGALLPAAAATGKKVTLVAAEYSGSTGARVLTAAGPTITLTNLWPTQYSVYAGTSAPTGGYPTLPVLPGGTLNFDVVVTP